MKMNENEGVAARRTDRADGGVKAEERSFLKKIVSTCSYVDTPCSA